ncbi:MAG: hypothetical protein IJY06_09300 [Oscillospiraceae bacterium]|nr:hypothetical protein [Oscillospiraceae bacterium]
MKKEQRNTWKRTAAWLCAAVISFGAAAPAVSAIEIAPQESGITAKAENLLTRDVICQNQSGVNYWESEHFQFIWGSYGTESSRVTQEFLEGNAKHLEACWDVYMNHLQMAPPTQSVNLSLRDGNEYKTNIYISGTGLEAFTDDWAYMSYDSGGFGYMFCCVDSMAYDTPSWVMPHEFAHVVTAHQLGWNENKYTYAWYETMGNWFREQFLYSDYYAPWAESVGGTDFFETYMKNLCFTFPFGRDYYAAWPFLQYLTENPDNLEGYGTDFVKTMLQEGQRDEYPLTMIDRLAPADMKDTLGHFAKRMATLDLAQQDRYRARLNQLFWNGAWNWGEIYTPLDRSTDDPNYYTVPTERAPQQAGINLVPLNPTGDTISVTLEGLTKVQGADWRACIVVEQSDGTTRYSDLFRSGETMQMAWNAGSDVQAFLTVAATPDTNTYVQVGLPYGPDSEFAETNYPFDSKTRYPYAVTLTGAEMQYEQTSGGASYGGYHPNGGGFVAATASVDASVYVGPNAKVLDYATVTGNAVITDYATVCGSANVSGNAIVSGHAVIAERASVRDNAIISDYAGVMGNAVVSDYGRVLESGLIYNDYQVSGNAAVKGVAFCMAKGSLSGQAIADGDYYDDGNKSVSAGTVYGWVSPESYTSSRPYTDGLYIGYEFSEDNGAIIEDTYTSTYGVAKNAPLWEQERTSGQGVMTFDGRNQYIIADSSMANFHDMEIQTAVLWRDTFRSDQRIFSFGDDERYMYLTASGTNDTLEFVINDGSGEQKLTTDVFLNYGEWVTINLSLAGDSAKLNVSGWNGLSSEVTGNITADPADVVSSDAKYYIGRGLDGNFFNGSMDYFRVNFKDVTDPDYYYTEIENPPSESGIFGDLDRDGNVDAFDLAILKRRVLEPDYFYRFADCNLDNTVDVTDVIALQKYLLGYGSDIIGTELIIG